MRGAVTAALAFVHVDIPLSQKVPSCWRSGWKGCALKARLDTTMAVMLGPVPGVPVM